METDLGLISVFVFMALVILVSVMSIIVQIRDAEVATPGRLAALPDDFKTYLRGLSCGNPKPWTNRDIDLALNEYAREASRRQALAMQQTALSVGTGD